jgi:hypothetical protein
MELHCPFGNFQRSSDFPIGEVANDKLQDLIFTRSKRGLRPQLSVQQLTGAPNVLPNDVLWHPEPAGHHRPYCLRKLFIHLAFEPHESIYTQIEKFQEFFVAACFGRQQSQELAAWAPRPQDPE